MDFTQKQINYYYGNKKAFNELWAKHNKVVKTYNYMVTFTLDPAKVPDPNLEDIETYIKSQFFRVPLKVLRASIILEGDGIETHYHWHVAVETAKSLAKDRFHYYDKKYGWVDIRPSKVSNFDDALNYMSKDNLPIHFIP